MVAWQWRETGSRLPLSFLSLSLLFFLIVVRDQPLRLGEMLHLVREEILLRPLYDPNPLFSSSASAGGHEGWVGGVSATPASCLQYHAPFAFLIMLQMCLMAEQSVYWTWGSRRNPGGLLIWAVMKKKKWEGKKGGREWMWICVKDRAREWSELEGEWEMEKDRGKEGEISEQRPTQQGSFGLSVCARARTRASGTTASPPSITVASGAADQTTLNKRNPFPSLLRSHVGRCERVCALEWLRVHMCVCSRDMGEGRRRCWRRAEGRGGRAGRWDRQEAAHIILHASSGWSLPGIMAHSVRQQWKKHCYVHISILSAFSSVEQTQLCPRCLPGHLPGRHLES